MTEWGLLVAYIYKGVEWLNLVTNMGLISNKISPTDFGPISPGQPHVWLSEQWGRASVPTIQSPFTQHVVHIK